MRRVSQSLIVAVVLVGAFWSAMVFAAGEPPPATTQRAVTYTYVDAAALVSGTTYSSPALTAQSVDPAQVGAWNEAIVYVSTAVSGASNSLVTVQFSPDNEAFADAYFQVADADGALIEHTYTISATADGTSYVRVPVHGEYMRLKFDTVGTVTTTAKVFLRNN